MDDIPNARMEIEPGVNVYQRVGGALKIRFRAKRDGSFIEYSSANMHVELNGMEIEELQELTLHFGQGLWPTATIKFALDDIDIDMDSLKRLEVFVKDKEDSDD